MKIHVFHLKNLFVQVGCMYFFSLFIRISIQTGRKRKSLPISLRLNAESMSSGMPFQDSPMILGKPGSIVFLSSSYLFTVRECHPRSFLQTHTNQRLGVAFCCGLQCRLCRTHHRAGPDAAQSELEATKQQRSHTTGLEQLRPQCLAQGDNDRPG